MVGISDPHYFSKIFKKYSGMTPSEYKETISIN
ncbi:MAG: AraC family transcriptional regulator [Ruminiclostridium sp.]